MESEFLTVHKSLLWTISHSGASAVSPLRCRQLWPVSVPVPSPAPSLPRHFRAGPRLPTCLHAFLDIALKDQDPSLE